MCSDTRLCVYADLYSVCVCVCLYSVGVMWAVCAPLMLDLLCVWVQICHLLECVRRECVCERERERVCVCV